MQKRRKRTKTKTTFEKLWEKFIKLEKIYNQDSVRVKTWKKVAFSVTYRPNACELCNTDGYNNTIIDI